MPTPDFSDKAIRERMCWDHAARWQHDVPNAATDIDHLLTREAVLLKANEALATALERSTAFLTLGRGLLYDNSTGEDGEYDSAEEEAAVEEFDDRIGKNRAALALNRGDGK